MLSANSCPTTSKRIHAGIESLPFSDVITGYCKVSASCTSSRQALDTTTPRPADARHDDQFVACPKGHEWIDRGRSYLSAPDGCLPRSRSIRLRSRVRGGERRAPSPALQRPMCSARLVPLKYSCDRDGFVPAIGRRCTCSSPERGHAPGSRMHLELNVLGTCGSRLIS